ncbi:hypothetical protein [Streptomyces sp. NPDC059455]|uniref:hypothetical protein n=1 Tax=Streptomyces sp. NPDC059455 TaxID=3346837 RepID=UPI00369458B0
MTYDDFPRPEFPIDATLTDGRCVKGKIVFPVPGRTRPGTIVYTAGSLGTPQEWTVPAE